MTRYTAEDLIAAIDELSAPQLSRYVELRLIRPVMSDAGAQFRDIDVARARLCARLAEDYGLDGDGLGLVLGLLDEMHGLRGEMQSLLSAIGEEPGETRERLVLRISRQRGA